MAGKYGKKLLQNCEVCGMKSRLLQEQESRRPPLSFEELGLRDPNLIAFLTPMVSPQPWRTPYHPVQTYPKALEIATSYIYCRHDEPTPFTHFRTILKEENLVRVFEIETNHYCMITHPRWLAKTMLSCDGRRTRLETSRHCSTCRELRLNSFMPRSVIRWLNDGCDKWRR
jgi:hypothetical protein